ncbi:unnamed protein product, partial [Closterium sp. NIES-53]
WYVQRGASRSSARCPYVIRTGDRAGQTCGTIGHTQSRCFSCRSDTWRAEFGDAAELPRWLELLRQGVDVFALDYEAILNAMYALTIGTEGDCSLCVLPDLGIEAAALGASESALPGTAPAEALHTFTLDSGASRCFFHDSTTLTPLPAPVSVRLADPSESPVVARSFTVLPCPAVPFGSLSGLHLPSFSTNLVSTTALQDAMVTTTTPGGQRVSICTCTQTCRHLVMFTRRPGSSLYTLATESPKVAASAQVSVLGQVPPPCSCRLLSHQTLLWHHRLGHPSLPRLHGMNSHLLVSGLPRSLPPLPPSPAPPYLPCIEGRQRAAPHSSSFPPTTAPVQTLHMDKWGPAHVSGQGCKRYFLLVIDDYTRYTTVFPLRSKGQDLPDLRLHSDRGGEFSSDLLRDFCRGEGILQSFMLLESPQQNGIAERRVGLVMEVARTSMIHADAPHFLWPFAVRYAAHLLKIWPHVSLPRPCLHCVGRGRLAMRRCSGSTQVLGVSSSTSLTPPLLCPLPDQTQLQLQPASPLPAPSRYTEQSGGLTKRREPASRPVLPVRTARRIPRSRPPPVPGTHAMALRPSSVPLHVPLPPPPESSLPEVPDPESDLVRAASPTISRLLTSVVTNPSFESTATCALVAELLECAVAYRLDYATALVAESNSATPPSIRGECALGTDVLEDKQEDFECLAAAVPRFVSMLLAPEGDPNAPDIPTPRSYAEAITGPYSSQWQAAMDAEMASWKSPGTYVDEVPPSRASIVDGMWIFRVKQPPGSPPVFKAHYVARGFSQRQGINYFHTFSPTPKMTTLRVLLHVAAQRDNKLHSLDFSTAFLQGSLHEEILLRRPPGFTGSFPITRDRARRTITLTLSHMVHQVLQGFGFQFSLPQPTLLSTDHSLLAPPSDESVEQSGPYPELVGCLMYLMTCTRPELTYPLSLLARYVAPGRHRKVHWDAAKRVLRYLCSMPGMGLVLGGWGPVVLTGHADASWVDDSAMQRSSCEAEIYAGVMAAQELRWLTYLLTDLGEQPRSPPILYVDNKAMIALCQEHRTKHIALRYFLSRELQQRGQLRLAYVATRANTADVFTKALLPGDHQRYSTVLGLVPTLPHFLTLALLLLTGLVTT